MVEITMATILLLDVIVLMEALNIRVGVMVAEVLAMEVVVVALLLHWLMEMLFRELLH